MLSHPKLSAKIPLKGTATTVPKVNPVFKKNIFNLGLLIYDIDQGSISSTFFCKMTKHDLVQFNTEVYYQKCCYLYQSNVYI